MGHHITYIRDHVTEAIHIANILVYGWLCSFFKVFSYVDLLMARK
jgi:hypothetical protein